MSSSPTVFFTARAIRSRGCGEGGDGEIGEKAVKKGVKEMENPTFSGGGGK